MLSNFNGARQSVIAFAVSIILSSLICAQNSGPEPGITGSARPAKKNASETARTPSFTFAEFEALTDPIEANNLGADLYRSADYERAAAAFARAVEIDATLSKAHTNLSVTYQILGRHNAALLSARRAVEADPANISSRSQLCIMLRVVKNHFEAVGCYEMLLRTIPDDAEALTAFGEELYSSGNIERAFAVLTHAFKIAPDNAEVLNAIGVVQFKKKLYRASAQSLKKAVEIDPDTAIFRYNLAMAQLANRNREGAFSQYALLKSTDPKLAEKIYRNMYAGQLVIVREK